MNQTTREKFIAREWRILQSLRTPAKIQDFLNRIPQNFERKGETCRSPLRVLRERCAHCMEGAMFAAFVLRMHGHKPLMLDLKSSRGDQDHVVALFRIAGAWGAISKTNHAVLRYREPIYRTIRELVLSYFHEYFLDNSGKKTLRSYSRPFNLSSFDDHDWMTSEKNLWNIPRALDRSPHTAILTAAQKRTLRRAEPIEIRAGRIIEWHR